jgi:hypothetical protein
MDDQSNAQLVDYFKDREVWLLQADVVPQHVVHSSPDIVSCAPEIDVGSAGQPANLCSCQSESK